MKTFQFQWRGLVNDLVIDVDAESRGRAVIRLRNLIEQWRDSDDPSTLDVTGDGVYARVWFNLDPDEVDFDHIVDSWEKKGDPDTQA